MNRLIDAEHFEQMLIDLIDNGDHKNAYVHHAYKMRNIAIKECRKMLWEEPTVDAVPVVHGHWRRGKSYPHNIYCSNCYRTYVPNEEIEMWKDDTRLPRKYCPECGAKMDEVTI